DAINRLKSTTVDPVLAGDAPGTVRHALTTSYEYDARGNIVGVIDPEGHRTEKDYDRTGALLEVRLCRGGQSPECDGTNEWEERTQYRYDKDGLLYQQIDGNNNITEFWYDSFGRKAYTLYPDKTGIATVYDPSSRTVAIRKQARL